MGKVTGNALLARALKQEGVDTVFYLAGGPMFDAMWESFPLGIRGIHSRHEQGAAMMAHGYARVSGRPGICNTSSGPGVINAATAMTNAMNDAVPIILLAGASSLAARDMDEFQEIDQVSSMRPLCKWAAQIHEPRRIPDYIAMAFRKATRGRPGPIHLDFPGDVLYGDCEESTVVFTHGARPAPPAGDPDAVREAVRMLKAAKRPVIISGSGSLWSGASEELTKFVELTNIPFYTTPQGRGIVPEDHRLSFLNARSTAFKEADVVLVLGTRFNVILGFGRSPRFNKDNKVIMVNTDAEEIGKNRTVDLGIVGDAKAVLKQFLAEADGGKWAKDTDWIKKLSDNHKRKEADMQGILNSDSSPIHPLRLCNEMRKFMDRDAILCVDGHDTLNFARQSIPTFMPNHRLNAGPNGCMGVGIPFAVGAKAAKPDKQVFALTGDGSFGMNGFEIETAVRDKLPIITVICNNGGWTADNPPKPGRDLPVLDYHKIVEVFGGHGERVERAKDIRPALERAAKAGVPACINVIVDPAAKSETARFSSYFQQASTARPAGDAAKKEAVLAKRGIAMKALEGIRVIDFTHDQAGPSCTQMLAWLGADVIKIEKPGTGDRARVLSRNDKPNPESYFYLTLNNNKRSTIINLKTEDGIELARKMVEKADVVAENLGPGAMDRLGFTWENVHKLNPRTVYASVKGFGSYGPYAKYKCFETVAQAMSGAMSVTGYPDMPLVTGANVGDSGTGMHLTIAILGALMQRERTGRGQRVEVAMQESALNLTRTKFAHTLVAGEPHPRTGNRSASNTFSDLYRCKGEKATDAVYLMVAPDNPEAFKALSKIIGRPDLLTDARFNTPQARILHYDEMGEAISDWTKQHDKRSVMTTFSAAGVACGMVLDTVEVLADPHLRERGTIFDMEHPTRGKMSMIGSPLRLSDSPAENRRAPMLGEHTDEVMKELFNYTDEDIARLRRDKVIF